MACLVRQRQQVRGIGSIRRAVGEGQVAESRERQPQHPQGPVELAGCWR